VKVDASGALAVIPASAAVGNAAGRTRIWRFLVEYRLAELAKVQSGFPPTPTGPPPVRTVPVLVPIPSSVYSPGAFPPQSL